MSPPKKSQGLWFCCSRYRKIGGFILNDFIVTAISGVYSELRYAHSKAKFAYLISSALKHTVKNGYFRAGCEGYKY